MSRNISGFAAGIYNTRPIMDYELIDVANIIKNDEVLKSFTEKLRETESKEERDKFKRLKLIFVTWGGLFKVRSDNGLITLSGYICIDADNLSQEEIDRIRESLIKSKKVIMFFVSPSGNGLKIILRLNHSKSYKENYAACSKWLIKEHLVDKDKIDSSCATVSKACFLCHDPEVYMHPDINGKSGIEIIPLIDDVYFKNQVLEQTYEEGNDEEPQINFFEMMEYQYYPYNFNYDKPNWINNFILLCRLNIRDNGQFRLKNRHNFVFHLAVLCNKFGLQKDSFLKHFETAFKNHPAIVDEQDRFSKKYDLLQPVENVYKNYKNDFNTWNKNNKEWETPIIPLAVYEALPYRIRKLVGLFTESREKDVFFIGYLTLLSALFPRIKGIYDGKVYRANLFAFISAPPGSGKGVLSWVRICGEIIHQNFLTDYKKALKEYSEANEEDKKQMLPPALRKLFIPANNTSAMLIQSLHINQIMGIIFDSEADSLSSANKADHGNFSHVLRKGWEHETIEYERKTNKEYIIIERPAVSIVISGTPNQVNNLISDRENGLTSRFIFYDFFSKAKFKNVFEKENDFEYIFRNEAVELASLVDPYLKQYLDNQQDEILFSFTSKQEQGFQSWFDEKLSNLDHIFGADIRGSINRLAVIHFRIAMILTIVREFEFKSDNSKMIRRDLICSDEDFYNSQAIIEVLMHHTTKIFKQLQAKSSHKNHRLIKDLFYEKLPKDFVWQQAKEIAEIMQVKVKTAENYLAKFIEEGKLSRIQHGSYSKQH